MGCFANNSSKQALTPLRQISKNVFQKLHHKSSFDVTRGTQKVCFMIDLLWLQFIFWSQCRRLLDWMGPKSKLWASGWESVRMDLGGGLCDSNGVRGFPTIKWGDPSSLEDYDGGRDYEALKKWAKENLKPMCDGSTIMILYDYSNGIYVLAAAPFVSGLTTGWQMPDTDDVLTEST